jgi:replicative DNA helicase
MATRTMPSNADAEMSVLGIAFLDERLISKICEEVTRDMFFLEKHQYIFDAITSLYKNNIPLDITTIKDELDKKKTLNAVGGIE